MLQTGNWLHLQGDVIIFCELSGKNQHNYLKGFHSKILKCKYILQYTTDIHRYIIRRLHKLDDTVYKCKASWFVPGIVFAYHYRLSLCLLHDV